MPEDGGLTRPYGPGPPPPSVRVAYNELADLTMAIAAINACNQMAISFRDLPGGHQPAQFNHLLERQAHRCAS
jgi:hypothetical protein